ncbi:MAG: family 10 glycosylhydrolase, partial [Candidatus Omnitrophota bacterium]|nr:family 10 glycosylhydrolase [Candidatus Omnitrophota bacterium]
MKNKIILFSLCLLCSFNLLLAEEPQVSVNSTSARGVWVSVFSSKKVLYSKEGVNNLIEQCKKARINEIYLQIFQSGNAYYDSKICDKTKYEQMVKAAGLDTLDLLLREAQENNINVFAWINVLSLGANDKADILSKYG